MVRGNLKEKEKVKEMERVTELLKLNCIQKLCQYCLPLQFG